MCFAASLTSMSRFLGDSENMVYAQLLPLVGQSKGLTASVAQVFQVGFVE